VLTRAELVFEVEYSGQEKNLVVGLEEVGEMLGTPVDLVGLGVGFLVVGATLTGLIEGFAVTGLRDGVLVDGLRVGKTDGLAVRAVGEEDIGFPVGIEVGRRLEGVKVGELVRAVGGFVYAGLREFLLGTTVGLLVDGATVGIVVGFADGIADGIFVGIIVVGLVDGANDVGLNEGKNVGAVGRPVGRRVGRLVEPTRATSV